MHTSKAIVYDWLMECMRLSHAGLIVTHDNATLLVDPGNFSPPSELHAALTLAKTLTALVITHEHADHWAPEHIAAIRNTTPSCPVFTTAATAHALAAHGITDAIIVADGDQHTVGPFTLDFYGGRHEELHSSMPVVDNIGVHINNTVAYGGDSLMRPPFAADVLGVPIGSPWSNLSQVMNFVLDARPKRAYITHDGMLSDRGHGMFTTKVAECLAKVGGELIELPHIDSRPARGYRVFDER